MGVDRIFLNVFSNFRPAPVVRSDMLDQSYETYTSHSSLIGSFLPQVSQVSEHGRPGLMDVQPNPKATYLIHD